MRDYISREALKQALTDKFKSRIGASRIPTWNDAFDAVTNIPAANVKPVVLCRDCIHYTNRYWDSGKCYGTFCDLWHRDFGKDAYCYRGKRRKNEDGHE